VFNNNLSVSSLFCNISLLYLPHCLPTRIHCTFLFFFLLCFLLIPIQCAFCFLSFSAAALHLFLHTCILCHNNSYLFFFSTFLCFVCILCMPCVQWFCMLCMSSALPVHHGSSSASLFVNPMCPSSLGFMIKLLHITNNYDSSSSVTVELNYSVAVTGSNAHPAVNRLHEQSVFYLQNP
jgi:hypothetical protein